MRTTIELTDEQRAALLALAARRGLRGYSSLVQEALAAYLADPPPAAGVRRRKAGRAKREDFASFVCDGFSTGRRDGSSRHDDYIYRGR